MSEETLRNLEDEINRLEAEVSRLRLLRSRTTYKLEQALREQDRLARHLVTLVQNDGAA
ncbi:MAG TPA: hypothetical protein VNA27_12470 [Rubrobacteraceae bacterium]|nr:hypothetical protein [Rubrobacteraceae bacterium]